MKHTSLLFLLAVTAPLLHAAAVQSQESIKITQTQKLKVHFLLYLPKGYNKKENVKWPVILFLHGAGERGDDLNRVKVHGPPKLVEKGQNLPFIIVSPQCSKGQIWDAEVLTGLLDHVCDTYRVDKTRQYLTGLSMGGYGTWSLGIKECDRFAAIAPICGGGNFIDIYNASGIKGAAIRTLGVWAFHGVKDSVVPLGESEKMIAGLKKFGHPNPKLTVYPEARHDSWTKSYENQKLYEWFLKHKRLAP
ncbi:MAG: prolyl oligopeptidase family serine peptidase [Verrucomicrobiota bacterium]|jgi:predicted peptidase|nr:prolyl oligopeptidase family serine peptidase [Verrucomicrobiota bacterium]